MGAFLWAGLNLASANFVYDSTGTAQRHTSIAYFNVLNGIGVSAGAFVGGWIIASAPVVCASQFPFVFLASSVLRLAGAMFRRLVKEVRPVGQIELRQVVFDLLGQRMCKCWARSGRGRKSKRPRGIRHGPSFFSAAAARSFCAARKCAKATARSLRPSSTIGTTYGPPALSLLVRQASRRMSRGLSVLQCARGSAPPQQAM